MAEIKMPTSDEIEDKLNTINYKSKTKYSTEKKDKNIQPVISDASHVKTREKSLGSKFAETFISDDINNVKKYLLMDVVVPAIKETIASVVIGGIEMILFGSTRSHKPSLYGTTSYVNYSSAYNGYSTKKQIQQPATTAPSGEIILETRGEAEGVLSSLVDLTVDYGSASVADLYDLLGVPERSNFTDNKYGWVDLSSSSVRRVREGYLIVLPKAILLD